MILLLILGMLVFQTYTPDITAHTPEETALLLEAAGGPEVVSSGPEDFTVQVPVTPQEEDQANDLDDDDDEDDEDDETFMEKLNDTLFAIKFWTKMKYRKHGFFGTIKEMAKAAGTGIKNHVKSHPKIYGLGAGGAAVAGGIYMANKFGKNRSAGGPSCPAGHGTK